MASIINFILLKYKLTRHEINMNCFPFSDTSVFLWLSSGGCISLCFDKWDPAVMFAPLFIVLTLYCFLTSHYQKSRLPLTRRSSFRLTLHPHYWCLVVLKNPILHLLSPSLSPLYPSLLFHSISIAYSAWKLRFDAFDSNSTEP